MKKLKIAQVVSLSESVPPTSQNGLEFVVSWLTEELVKRGHDVTLFASADSVTKAKLISLLPRALHQDKMTKHLPSFFLSIWNSLIAAKEKFDIVHCHNLNAVYLAPFAHMPIVETIHGAYNSSLKDVYIDSPEYAKYFKPVFDEFAKVNYVLVSKNQESEHLALADTYFKKHTVIHNGIPVSNFTFNNTPKDYLFYIGYINKNKGADIAVQVAKKLDMKLIIAGNAVGEEVFFEEHIKPHLNDKIQYIGPVDFNQKNELYGNALATLAPLAWSEPFGLTLVESQACGTPVIAFNKGAASEIIKHGETGFVVKTEEEMIDAIGKIDTIQRQKCREWVENNFSMAKMVDEYEKYYLKLTEK